MRRIRSVGEAAVPDWVQREARKFVYPDFDTIGATAQPGGGGGAPTVVIAASDATDLSKSKADFVCTGVNDQGVIQQAIDQFVPTSPFQGFRVLLTEGVFNINMAGQSFEGIRLDYGTIQGMGSEATIVNAATAPSVSDNPLIWGVTTNCTIRDLSCQGGAVTGILINSDRSLVENCLMDTSGIAINITNDPEYVIIRGNYLFGSHGVFVTGSSREFVIVDNVMSVSSDGINLGSGGLSVVVAGNVIDGSDNGIEALNLRNVAIANNAITDPASNGIRLSWTSTLIEGEGAAVSGNTIRDAGLNGIHIDARTGGGFSQPVVLAGNYILRPALSGFLFDDIDDVMLASNEVYEPNRHGIETQDECNRFHVHGNTIIRPGQETDNTYDGIFLNTNCSEWFIHGNQIQGDVSAPQPRYAVNVSAASDTCNIVVGNDLGPLAPYGTDALNDAGTDTQLFYPNDPTYGDNFTDCPTSPSSP